MHYRHSFHAGNFADVFKHSLLCGLLLALNRKPAPWLFLDTHAGSGVYDLRSLDAQRTHEWRDGVGRMLGRRFTHPALSTLMDVLASLNGGAPDQPALYPGSPAIAAVLARPGDRLLGFELVPAVAAQLEDQLRRHCNRSLQVHQRDGYEAHALLPPLEKRGLVLIDPAFERPDEFEAAGDFLLMCMDRFANGVYALWYPSKNRFEAERFLRRMGRELKRPALNFHIDTDAAAQGQMRGCGVLVVNPPYQFGEQMQPALDELARTLGSGPRAACAQEWTRPETSA